MTASSNDNRWAAFDDWLRDTKEGEEGGFFVPADFQYQIVYGGGTWTPPTPPTLEESQADYAKAAEFLRRLQVLSDETGIFIGQSYDETTLSILGGQRGDPGRFLYCDENTGKYDIDWRDDIQALIGKDDAE